MEKCIIVAIADNNAIGRDNALLWHISEDLKFFKRTTTGCPVIMGRKTFESIGRPLPKRTNIVVSRGFDAPEGVVVVGSLSEAYTVAGSSVIPDSSSVIPSASSVIPSASSVIPSASSVIPSAVEESPSRCFVIGGGQIYAQALADADRLVVTHVHTIIKDADTFFPQIDPSVWEVEDRSEMFHDEESGFDFEFVTYKRSRANV
ncbi:MAG: dihydrofolate reductase [Bacteroidales bacterium]|nr:dihydrofolate reductase [Bacteroidales bacterium]